MGQEAKRFVAPEGVCISPFGRHRWIEPILIAVMALVLNLAGNSRTGLWDRDEPRYAVAVREMRGQGDWIVPSFNGEPRYHKPILIYWLMGLSTALVGETPFGARLVSAFAGTCTCVLVWALGRRLLGPRQGLLAAAMLAVAPIMVAESKLATTDATLALWVVGGQFCLWELSRRPSRWLAMAFWAVLGLAVLTKGPIGPCILAVSSALAWWCGWPATTAWRRLQAKRGLVVFALIAVPWSLAVAIATRGKFFEFAVGNQIVQRISSGMEEHGGFPGYYPVVSALVFYPWSALVPAALLGAWVRRKSSPALGFLLGWVVGPLILLESFQTKLIHYYLPCFPACALVTSWLVHTVIAEELTIRRWPLGRLGMGLLGGLGIVLAIGAFAAAITFPSSLRLALLGFGMTVGAGTMTSLLWLHQAKTMRAVSVQVATWGLAMLILGGWLIPAAEPFRTSRLVGEHLAVLSSRLGIEPFLLDYKEPGVIYAFGQPVPTVTDAISLLGQLEQKKELLTVVTPAEAELYRTKFGLVVSPVEELGGFSLTKGRRHDLRFAILRMGQPPSSDEASTPGIARGEGLLVK